MGGKTRKAEVQSLYKRRAASKLQALRAGLSHTPDCRCRPRPALAALVNAHPATYRAALGAVPGELVGLYQRYVLPRLLDAAMRLSEVQRYRAELIPRAHGAVLEIGIGSGLNLPFYGAAVDRLDGVDPSAELLAMTRRRIGAVPFTVDLLASPAETLPLEDASFDVAVTTFTLCSVSDPAAVLREVRRVLKPGGTLLFAEHGLAPDAGVERWQHRLNPAWTRFAGGCNLDRRIDALIVHAGFALTEVTRGYAKGPKPLSYIYSGEAVAQ
jgi:SAM-dependent methyltransferase